MLLSLLVLTAGFGIPDHCNIFLLLTGKETITVELQRLEHLWNHGNMFETRVVRANGCYSLHQVMRHNRDIFSTFFIMKVCCVFSLGSPHIGDSKEYTQYTVFNIKKKITLNYPRSAAMGFFQGTQERVRNSRGKRAISVRITEVLLYKQIQFIHWKSMLFSNL